jgi:hypothetical protein
MYLVLQVHLCIMIWQLISFDFFVIMMTSAVPCNSVINSNPFLSILSLSAYTENLFAESMSHHLLFDKTVAVKQLHVVEAHGILLFRTDRGNCGILYLLSKQHHTLICMPLLFPYGLVNILKTFHPLMPLIHTKNSCFHLLLMAHSIFKYFLQDGCESIS